MHSLFVLQARPFLFCGADDFQYLVSQKGRACETNLVWRYYISAVKDYKDIVPQKGTRKGVVFQQSLTQGQAKKEKEILPVHNAYLTSIHQDLRYFAYIVHFLVLYSDIDWAIGYQSVMSS